MKRSIAVFLSLALTPVACDEPAAPPAIEAAWLLDRVNGGPLPGQVCADDAVEQEMLFESIALLDDGSYGRLQQVRLDGEDVIEQEERGTFARTDSTLLLINAAEDTIVLALLDEEAQRLRRIHACGDTLRYSRTSVAG